MALVADLLSGLPSSPEEMYKQGAVILQEIFRFLKESKTRKVLKQMEESLSKFQPLFKDLEEKKYKIALKALQETRDAKTFLFATDMELRVLALETIKTTEQCKKIVEVMEKNPKKTTKGCEYIEKTMKSLMERSKVALDTATKKFQDLIARLNKTNVDLEEFVTELDKLEGRLKDKQYDAQEAAKPGFWGTLFSDYAKEKKVVEKYNNTIKSVKDAKENKTIIEEMLNTASEEIEAARQKLTLWIAVVNKNKDGYDQGNHAQALINFDFKMLTDEFDELKGVCLAYIELCNTDEKNKEETETSNRQ